MAPVAYVILGLVVAVGAYALLRTSRSRAWNEGELIVVAATLGVTVVAWPLVLSVFLVFCLGCVLLALLGRAWP